MCQRVFFVRVNRHPVFAGPGRVYELDYDVGANALDVPVAPFLKRIGGSLTAAFFDRAVIAAARRMCFALMRRAVLDVDHYAIGLPAGNSRCESLICISDAAIVLFLEFVLLGVRRRIAAQPELLDELVALVVIRKTVERFSLVIGDDVRDVLVDPGAVGFQLLTQVPIALLLARRWLCGGEETNGTEDYEQLSAPRSPLTTLCSE